jgi:hypothetical protein
VTSKASTLTQGRNANRQAVPSSPILITLMKEALRSYETSALTRVTRRNIPDEAILYSRHRENLKSYKVSFYLNPGQPRTLLQLKLVGILMINLFLT